ncbi:spore germination protein Q [Paenibacillus sp. RU4T]|uniref:spore coat protein GerQ n=1 Tax=Paenibacillus sp. RU4T TaxID=1907394 RepID=UPI0009556510|nr:spore coat protein GerQ [Paenibacillus sp. RUD330]SIP98085.1 spore germination protein Q [Paenibacillus sp. RU4X]SIQ16806.1 spore germination protein Q [Paenibacillus sp. RU4T]
MSNTYDFDYYRSYGAYGHPSVGGAGTGYGQPSVGGVNAAMYSHDGMMIPGAAFMQMPPGVPSGSVITPNAGTITTVPAREESYVENILRLNRSKMATFYMTYENNKEWNAKIFRGVIEAAGRDHIIIRDPATNMRYLLLTLNLDYVTFDGPIAYEYQFQGQTISNLTPETER